MHKIMLLPALVTALALTGCATTASSPVDVTRFHSPQGAALAPGSFTIDTASPFAPAGLEGAVWSDAVAGELGKLGFRRDGGEGAAYVVTVRHHRGQIDPGQRGRRSPVSVGVGGSTGGGYRSGIGVGLGIGIDLSGPPKPRLADDLSVQISRKGDNVVVWEGRASSDAKQGSAAAQPNVMAAKMAEALFRGFPGESGKSITVRP